MLGNVSGVCSLLIFFKMIFFEKFFQEYHQRGKQFRSRSGLTFCQAWSRSKPLAKIYQISIWWISFIWLCYMVWPIIKLMKFIKGPSLQLWCKILTLDRMERQTNDCTNIRAKRWKLCMPSYRFSQIDNFEFLSDDSE